MLIQQQLLASLIAAAAVMPALAETPAAPTVEISAPRARAAAPSRDLQGVFETSTGRNIVVDDYGNVLRVRYGRMPAKMLRLDASGDYVSADGMLSMHVDPRPARGAQTVQLTMPASWQ